MRFFTNSKRIWKKAYQYSIQIGIARDLKLQYEKMSGSGPWCGARAHYAHVHKLSVQFSQCQKKLPKRLKFENRVEDSEWVWLNIQWGRAHVSI
jgi:hypothetical protein